MTNFPPDLKDLITQIAAKAETWGRIHAEAAAEKAEKTRRENEEFEAEDQRFEEFCEKYLPDCRCSFNDAMQLFREHESLQTYNDSKRSGGRALDSVVRPIEKGHKS